MRSEVKRQIRRAFIANPGATLSTGDLIRWCYPRRTGLVRIKHCFAVRRAAEAVADRVGKGWRSNILWRAKPSQLLPNSEQLDD